MAQSTPPAGEATSTPQSFLQCLGHFLTPQLWKQARHVVPQRRAWRWQTQPLIVVLLVMTWSAGDSLSERFETARAFYVALHQRRRRPGKTCEGFEKALGQLPLPVLRAVAQAVRHRLGHVFADRLLVGGFVPLGCDGSRVACPRTPQLEQRLGRGKKKNHNPPRQRRQARNRKRNDTKDYSAESLPTVDDIGVSRQNATCLAGHTRPLLDTFPNRLSIDL
jgi:hypothetical protein